jgi:hypothetical protein
VELHRQGIISIEVMHRNAQEVHTKISNIKVLFQPLLSRRGRNNHHTLRFDPREYYLRGRDVETRGDGGDDFVRWSAWVPGNRTMETRSASELKQR